jgi:hypothetical protein
MWEPWRLKGTGESAISVTCWVTDEVAAEEEGDAGAAGRDVWRRQCRGRRGRRSAGAVVLAREKWDAGAGAIGGIGTKEEGDGGATTASRRRCQVESARGGGGGSRSCG